MGTPDFAKESLQAIVETKKHEICGVLTNPDKPKGRGMKMVASPVKEYALQQNIDVYQPEKIRKNEELIEKIKMLKPDLICVVAYGKILPKSILEIPKFGCINVHASLLPKYRGAAPIQWAVINGEKTTGVTTMYMDIGMDTGDMILKQEIQIGEEETTGELWERLAKIGGKLLVETIHQIEMGTAPREKQGDDFSLAPMLTKEMAHIDWKTMNAVQIKNLIRGLNPIMGAVTTYEGKKMKIWKARAIAEEEYQKQNPEYQKSEAGSIIMSNAKQGLYIQTKDGILEILEIQGENAKRLDILSFLRGTVIEQGKYFY